MVYPGILIPQNTSDSFTDVGSYKVDTSWHGTRLERKSFYHWSLYGLFSDFVPEMMGIKITGSVFLVWKYCSVIIRDNTFGQGLIWEGFTHPRSPVAIEADSIENHRCVSSTNTSRKADSISSSFGSGIDVKIHEQNFGRQAPSCIDNTEWDQWHVLRFLMTWTFNVRPWERHTLLL